MADQLSPKSRVFLEEKRYAILATINEDGTPQQTVMWYLLDGDRIMMNTKRHRRKDRNIRRDQRISVCVADGEQFVTITGNAIIDDDGARAQATARALAVRYDGEEAAEEQMRRAFSKEHRVTVYLPIESVISRGFDE